MRIFAMTLGLVLMSFLSFTQNASAQAILSVGQNLLFENGNNGRSIDTQQPLSVRGGYRFGIRDLYLEYSSFQSAQGTPSVQVVREHSEWLAWGRRVLAPKMKFAPYAAAGLGLQYDKIETTIPGESKRDQGEPHPVLALASGFLVAVREGLELQLEVKAASSSNYAPNPLMGLAFFVGYRF